MQSSPTAPVIALHVLAGTIALCAGTAALLCRKGARAHRLAGQLFCGSLIVMAACADYLAVVVPDQIANLIVGTFAIYLVATAWMTVRRRPGTAGRSEQLALAVSLCLAAPFLVLNIQLAAGLPPLIRSAIPLEGVVRVFLLVFTALLVLCAAGDARLVLAGGVRGARRIGRHLWRMCLGLALAAGSAFTNGLPRLLPPTVQVPLLWLFVPQLACLGWMVYWMVRVRFFDGYWNRGPADA